MKLVKSSIALISAFSLLLAGFSATAEDVVEPQLDQWSGIASNAEAGYFGDNIGQRIYQTITPSLTGYLTSIELAVSKKPGTVGNINVDVMLLSRTGVPLEGNLLASEPVSSEELPDQMTWLMVNFSEPAYLVANVPFAIRLVGDNANQMGESESQNGEIYFRWHNIPYLQPHYVGGSEILIDDERLNTWRATGNNYGFETYMRPFIRPSVSQSINPKVSVFLKSKVKIPNTREKAAIQKVAKNVTSAKMIVCTGYTYGTSAAARAYSLKLAKAMCAVAKAASPRIRVISETKSSATAVRAARGSKWQAGSFRVDLSLRNTAD
jgi:hypothetical protein